MDPRYDIPRRAAAGGGSGGSENSSPALGAQSRRRKMPPRPADFKLQIIIIGSRGVGKTSLMERFTDDTFCESCKSTVGVDFKIKTYASEEAELLLVGNKLDCETDRIISKQQGERFASRITGMRFCESSAKDNYNVDEIFVKLVDDILSKMPLEVPNKELSNSVLSLQPEPEVPPELPPPRMRCC
ncbi:hypothetical protein CCH79_00009668 [Gambusia affinis]|uniref:small monomeric GTPase n=1 Tax=Gambusia affinis TaxID=33528 RepID=A0A315W4B4_GAMAF|nr:hypothetical protein CCH79_00009668 [Gambusia affinis]